MEAHLWGNVVRGPTEGSGLNTTNDTLLAEPKVCNLNVAFCIQHHIVKLQVAVDYPSTMQKEKS